MKLFMMALLGSPLSHSPSSGHGRGSTGVCSVSGCTRSSGTLTVAGRTGVRGLRQDAGAGCWCRRTRTKGTAGGRAGWVHSAWLRLRWGLREEHLFECDPASTPTLAQWEGLTEVTARAGSPGDQAGSGLVSSLAHGALKRF